MPSPDSPELPPQPPAISIERPAAPEPAQTLGPAHASEPALPPDPASEPAIDDAEFAKLMGELGITEADLIDAQRQAEAAGIAAEPSIRLQPASTFDQAVAIARQSLPHLDPASLCEDWRSFAIAALGAHSSTAQSQQAVAQMADDLLLHFIRRQARLQ